MIGGKPAGHRGPSPFAPEYHQLLKRHRMRHPRERIFPTVLAFILAATVWLLPRGHAQSTDPAAALLADYQWRSIGPASAGGRITDIAALDTDFRYAIVAAASGGVWKTVNAGTTWTPIFRSLRRFFHRRRRHVPEEPTDSLGGHRRGQ